MDGWRAATRHQVGYRGSLARGTLDHAGHLRASDGHGAVAPSPPSRTRQARVKLAGVDGCKAGWIVVHREPGAAPSVSVFPSFPALLEALPDAIIAVDMPIGLPDFSRKGGRGP